MPITEPEWLSIRSLIEKLVRQRGEYFVTGKVIKTDPSRKLIWLEEFGDQAIPLIAFDYEVKYYDTNQAGTVIQKNAKVAVKVPQIGQTVLVAREQGSRSLPRCLGVIQSLDWFSAEED